MPLTPLRQNEKQVWWQHPSEAKILEIFMGHYYSNGRLPVALVLKMSLRLPSLMPRRVWNLLTTAERGSSEDSDEGTDKQQEEQKTMEDWLPFARLLSAPLPTIFPFPESHFLRPAAVIARAAGGETTDSVRNGILFGALGRLTDRANLDLLVLWQQQSLSTNSTSKPNPHSSVFFKNIVLGLILGGQVDVLNSLYSELLDVQRRATEQQYGGGDTPSGGMSRQVSSMSDAAIGGGSSHHPSSKSSILPLLVEMRWTTESWNAFHLATWSGHGNAALRNLQKIFLESATPSGGDYSAAVLGEETGNRGKCSSSSSIKELMVQGTETTENKTPLLVAAEIGNTEAIEYFLDEKNVGPEGLLEWLDSEKKTQTEGNRLVIAAASCGRQEVLQLLHNTFDVDVTCAMSQQGKNILHVAAQENQMELVSTLLDELHMDVNGKTLGKGCSAIFIAAEKNYPEIIRLLAKHGGDVNLAKTGGWTPLLAAVERDNREAIEALVSLNADMSQCNDYGMSTIFVAAHENHLNLVKYLLSHAQNSSSTTTSSDEQEEEEKEGASKKVDILGAKRLDGWTALTAAAYKNNPEMIRVLHAAGAAVNNDSGDRSTLSPAHIAAQAGNTEALQVLHELGADMNMAVAGGWTPLLFAAHQGQAETCKLLVSSLGADVNAKTSVGVSAVSLAAQNEDLPVIRALASVGADLEATDEQGLSAVCVAAYTGKERSITVLHSLGANIRTADNWPMRLAFQNNHPNVMDLLVRLGAKPLKSYGFGLNRCRTVPSDDDDE